MGADVCTLYRILECLNWELYRPPPTYCGNQGLGKDRALYCGSAVGLGQEPASWPLYTEAPNRGVWVMVYFGARTMLIFPPTQSIFRGWSSRGGRNLGPGLFLARVASLGERLIVGGGGWMP